MELSTQVSTQLCLKYPHNLQREMKEEIEFCIIMAIIYTSTKLPVFYCDTPIGRKNKMEKLML